MAAAMARRLVKKPMKMGACTNMPARLFIGLHLYFFHTAITRAVCSCCSQG